MRSNLGARELTHALSQKNVLLVEVEVHEMPAGDRIPDPASPVRAAASASGLDAHGVAATERLAPKVRRTTVAGFAGSRAIALGARGEAHSRGAVAAADV